MYSGPFEHVPKFGRQFVGKTWLHEETGTALLLGAFPQRGFVVAREQNNWNLSRSCVALQIVKQLPSVTAGQREVRDDDVGVAIEGLAVGGAGIGGRDRVEPERG